MNKDSQEPKDKVKFTTTLDRDLVKQLKIRAIDLGLNANDLIEEGIEFILKKYSSPQGNKKKV